MAFENGARGISPRVSNEEDRGRTPGDGSGLDGGADRYRRGTRADRGRPLVDQPAQICWTVCTSRHGVSFPKAGIRRTDQHYE